MTYTASESVPFESFQSSKGTRRWHLIGTQPLCVNIRSPRIRSLAYWVMLAGYVLCKINKYLKCLRFALIFQKIWSNSGNMFGSWECQNVEQTSLDPKKLQYFQTVSTCCWWQYRTTVKAFEGEGWGMRRTLKNFFGKISFVGSSSFLEACPLLNQFWEVAGNCPEHFFKWFKTIKYYNENLIWENMWKS